MFKNLDSRHKADLLVYGPCSNAGDVLIYEAILKLFEDKIETNYCHIRKNKLTGDSPNVIIGPGGLLSGSYKPDTMPDDIILRHMNQVKIEQWEREGRKLFCFATGTNTPFNASASAKPFSKTSEETIAKFVKASQKIYLRGSADINRIQGFCRSEDLDKFVFQPCPSLFIDKLFGIKPEKKDRIAVNFPFLKIRNLAKHPISRFVDYSHSIGLKVDFVDNHPMDFNSEIYSVFDGTTHSHALRAFHTGIDPDYEKAQIIYQAEWEGVNPIATRFNGYRFAFGSRLHAFLPFMSFETPTVFLTGNPIRMPMPLDYFGNPIFLAKQPYGGKDMNGVVDGMIDRLDFL